MDLLHDYINYTQQKVNMCEGFALPPTHTAHMHILAFTHSVVNIPINYYTMILGATAALQFCLEAADYQIVHVLASSIYLCTVFTDVLRFCQRCSHNMVSHITNLNVTLFIKCTFMATNIFGCNFTIHHKNYVTVKHHLT